MFFMILAYLQKDDFRVKRFMILSAFFWGAHYFLLGFFA